MAEITTNRRKKAPAKVVAINQPAIRPMQNMFCRFHSKN